jgi:hypothetical protein
MDASKRQNIILGIAILAVIYGLYNVMIVPRQKSGAPGLGSMGPADVQTFISQVATDIRSAQTDFNAYAGSSAERPWLRNPFFVKERASGGPRRPEFFYTGYLEAAGRTLAIINHAEYQVGEQLESREGFFLKEITPSRIIIENRPAKTDITVPLHD